VPSAEPIAARLLFRFRHFGGCGQPPHLTLIALDTRFLSDIALLVASAAITSARRTSRFPCLRLYTVSPFLFVSPAFSFHEAALQGFGPRWLR